MYSLKTQALLQDLQRIGSFKREFSYYPANAINKGIVQDYREFDECIHTLLNSGELIKTKVTGGTNWYSIPVVKDALIQPHYSSGSPTTIQSPVNAFEGYIIPYDLNWYLVNKSTEVDGKVVPLSTVYSCNKDVIPQVQEYFRTNSLLIPNTSFQIFTALNQRVIEIAIMRFGVAVVNAYLGIWWKYIAFEPASK